MVTYDFDNYTSSDDFALNLLIEKNVIGTYNIGNGNEILPIDNIAKMIIDKIGNGVIEYVDIPITRTAYKIGDFTKLKNKKEIFFFISFQKFYFLVVALQLYNNLI